MLKLTRLAAQILIADLAAFLLVLAPWLIAHYGPAAPYHAWGHPTGEIMGVVILVGFFSLATLAITGALTLIKYLHTAGDKL